MTCLGWLPQTDWTWFVSWYYLLSFILLSSPHCSPSSCGFQVHKPVCALLSLLVYSREGGAFAYSGMPAHWGAAAGEALILTSKCELNVGPLIESWTPPQSSHWCNRSLSHTYTLQRPLVHWTNDDNNRTVVRRVVIQAIHMEVFWQDETFWLTLPKYHIFPLCALYPDEPQSNFPFPDKLICALCKVCKRYHCMYE